MVMLAADCEKGLGLEMFCCWLKDFRREATPRLEVGEHFVKRDILR